MSGFLIVLIVAVSFVALVFYVRSHKRGVEAAERARALEEMSARLQSAEAHVQALNEVEQRYRPIMDLEAALRSLQQMRDGVAADAERAQGEFSAEKQKLDAEIERLRLDLSELSEEEYFASYGLYEPKYDFESSERYREALDALRQEQKATVKAGGAALCHREWTVEGSAAKGRKMIKDMINLVLRAFNGECDAAIAKVKYNNVAAIEKRIRKARESIDKLSAVNLVEITDGYLELKLRELYLFHEFEEKKQAEKEEQRLIKEQMREEKRAEQELERARRQAEEEEQRYQLALDKARADVERATGAKQAKLARQIEELQARLAEAHANSERAMSRAQMTRSGHVYVISNIGSFGDDIYKIGMTRRLEPLDRVKELSDASVPFSFDVHAIIYADDAPKLENELHKRFHTRRVNLVNERKEFFRVSLTEIAQATKELHGEVELTRVAAAVEYRKTESLRRKNESTPLAVVAG